MIDFHPIWSSEIFEIDQETGNAGFERNLSKTGIDATKRYPCPLCQDTARPKLSFSPNENFWQEGCSWCARSPILGVIVPDLHGELVAKKSRIETVDFERPLCLELDGIVTEYIISAKTKTFGKREGIDCFKNKFLEGFAKILMVNSLPRNLVLKYSKNFALRWDSNFIFPVRSAGIRSLLAAESM